MASDCAAAPTTDQPRRRASASVWGKLRQECTGISSSAPELALETTALRGAELRRQVSTPAAPRKKAERSAAPKFCCKNR